MGDFVFLWLDNGMGLIMGWVLAARHESFSWLAARLYSHQACPRLLPAYMVLSLSGTLGLCLVLSLSSTLGLLVPCYMVARSGKLWRGAEAV